MILDLENLTQEQYNYKLQLGDKILSFYNSCFDTIQKNMPKNINGQLNILADRNSCSSNAFFYIENLIFVKEYLDKFEVEQIETKDKVLYEVLKGQFPIIYTGANRFFSSKIFHIIKALLFYTLWAIRCIKNRSKLRVEAIKKLDEVIFVESDVMKHSDSYNDRYYTGLWEQIPDKWKSKVYYFIQFLPIPYSNEFKTIEKNSKQNIIYLNDFLKVSDYVYALKMVNISRKYRNFDISYDGFSLAPLFNILYFQRYRIYNIYPFLYERVIHNMKECNINIKCFVDWYENQSYDKGLYYAFNKYYPTVPINSYVGYIKDYRKEPYGVPSEYEIFLNLAPSCIFACSQLVKNNIKNQGYKGNVEIVPFFRSQKVYTIHYEANKESNGSKYLLALLGLNMIETKSIVSYLCKLEKELPEGFSIYIKPHPACPSTTIQELITENCKRIEVISGDTYELILSSFAVIGANSTSMYEAMALGVPVISLESDGDSNDLKYTAYSPKEVPEILNKISTYNKKELIQIGNILRKYYFEPTTQDGTNKLLSI